MTLFLVVVTLWNAWVHIGGPNNGNIFAKVKGMID